MRTHIAILLCSVFLVVGCGGDDSTTPPPTDQTLQLRITATFLNDSPFAAVTEARVQVDGVDAGTTTCPNFPGCRPIIVNGSTTSTTRGSHTVELKVISHTLNVLPTQQHLSYTLSGTVNVLRAGSVVQQIALETKQVQLGPGDKSTYTINVNP